MSITTIFPNSHREIDDQIVFHSDDASCLALSRVSKRAQEVITNPLFQIRFFAQHPHLLRFQDKLFTTLRNNHPGSCWKIVCDAFSSKKRVSRYVSADTVSIFWEINKTSINFPFFASATPSICSSLQSQKAVCESQIREICGFGFEDPNSPIDKAWKATRAFEDEYSPLQLKMEELYNIITAGLSDEDIQQLNDLVLVDADQQFLNGEVSEDLLNKSDKEILPLKREHFPQYILMIRLMQEAHSASISIYELYNFYYNLESNRVGCEIELKEINEKLSFLTAFFPWSQELKELTENLGEYREYFACLKEKPNLEAMYKGWDPIAPQMMNPFNLQGSLGDIQFRIEHNERRVSSLASSLKGDLNLKQKYFSFFKKQQKKIQEEIVDARKLEKRAIQYSQLLACSNAIQEAIDNPPTTFPQHIADSINAMGTSYLSSIWGELYERCANGYDQPRWSEIHFPEFLPELQNILKESLNEYQYRDLQENQNT